MVAKCRTAANFLKKILLLRLNPVEKEEKRIWRGIAENFCYIH